MHRLKININLKSRSIKAGIAAGLLVLALGLVSGGLLLAHHDKVYRARVLGVSISGLDKESALKKLESNLSLPEKLSIEIKTVNGTEKFEIFTDSIDGYINYGETVNAAYNSTREGNLGEKFKKVLGLTARAEEHSPTITYSSEKLDEQLAVIAGQVYIAPQYPNVHLNGAEAVVESGSIGYELNIAALKENILANLSTLSGADVTQSTHSVGETLNTEEIEKIKQSVDYFSDDEISLAFERFEKRFAPIDLIRLSFNIDGTKDGPFETLLAEIEPVVNREPANPVFKEENGKVIEFKPSIEGAVVNRNALKSAVLGLVTEAKAEAVAERLDIPISSKDPQITTEQVNAYGIKELVGYGESNFRGSISNRVHNIALAAEKINGALIAPGEVFSFNNTVGDISVYTGFRQSYVIQGNETVLGDGGGVCQVSTTLFRAVLASGLPIVERRPHSYRVGYYEQGSPPGIDATIYSPTVDFKFKNDTPAYILVQATADIENSKLLFELYGTKDGRVASITKPVVSEVSEPPEDLYIDDPSLPAGEVKQIDYKAWGAKVSFSYNVTKDGETIYEKTFFSNYRPWQAKFLRGTGPAQSQ